MLSFLLISCPVVKGNYKTVAEFLNNEKICITRYNGEKECLKLNKKIVYIIPYLDTLYNEFYLTSNEKEFFPLMNNFDVIEQINSLSGQKIPSLLYDNLKLNLTEDINKAQLKLSFTYFYTNNEYNYCVIQIIENKYKKWIVKLKQKDGEIIANEISQILN